MRAFPSLHDQFKQQYAGRGSVNSTNSTVTNAVPTNYNSIQQISQPPIELLTMTLLNPEYEVDTFIEDYDDLMKYCSQITVYADSNDSAIRNVTRCTGITSLGSVTKSIIGTDNKALDVDIIDTSDLTENIESNRHGYFNVNRAMVDDLVELVTTCKKACERSSKLITNEPGVYRFAIIPPTITTV